MDRRDTYDSKQLLLREVLGLAACPPREVRLFASIAEVVSVEPGFVLAVQGKPVRWRHLVLDGAVIVSDQRSIETQGHGRWWPVVDPLQQGGEPSPHTVATLTRSTVLSIGPQQVPSLPHDVPCVAAAIAPPWTSPPGPWPTR